MCRAVCVGMEKPGLPPRLGELRHAQKVDTAVCAPVLWLQVSDSWIRWVDRLDV